MLHVSLLWAYTDWEHGFMQILHESYLEELNGMCSGQGRSGKPNILGSDLLNVGVNVKPINYQSFMLQLEVIGNLGADAQVKNAQGAKFITFSVAHTDKWKSEDGQEHRETTWVDCIINDPDSKVFPYLKAGVKVWVRGNARLRVYSSPKERKMKAGLTLNVRDVELCGGSSDDVPRELVNPSDGTLYKVTKHYWCDAPTKGMKKEEAATLVDKQGYEYVMNCNGFVSPKPAPQDAQEASE